MKKIIPVAAIVLFALSILVAGCGSGGQTEKKDGENNEGESKAAQVGALQFTANGEDFVRQGFVTRDGWNLSFDHVYVNLAEVTAYQSDPPYDSEKGGEVAAKHTVGLQGAKTVDLAEGDNNASPIPAGEVKDAPTGHYNAISWSMLKAAEGPARDYSLVIAGKAEKEGKTVNFTIKDETEYKYTGGEYVGDERKGIVQEGGSADMEMTFHFDHIFGDAGTPADDELNVGAVGFEPFAALAKDGVLDVSVAALKEKMAPADFAKLLKMLPTLGHVGEGHCHNEVL
jgi:hypothetical protein